MRFGHCSKIIVVSIAFLLTSCGVSDAPTGRWEGFSQSANWVVAIRLQVDKGNVIHATALSIQVAGTSLPERVSLTQKVRAMLPSEWKHAPIGKIDFKENIITRAGGFAPLFVYDPKRRTMLFNFYAGGKLTEHIRMYPVKEFMVTD
jgi:hypothetical protein